MNKQMGDALVQEFNESAPNFILKRALEVIADLEMKGEKGELYIRCLELISKYDDEPKHLNVKFK